MVEIFKFLTVKKRLRLWEFLFFIIFKFFNQNRSCQAFLNKHEDLLEEALVRKFHHKMGVWLCHEVSDSCSGVVRLNADTPEDNQV